MTLRHRARGITVLACFLGFSSSPVFAEEEPLALQPAKKLARGVTNLATGWLEVPKQVYEVGREEGWLVGLARAPFDGLGMSVARTVAGMYEMVTFPIPAPFDYQPLLEPTFVWERDQAAIVEPTADLASPVTPAP